MPTAADRLSQQHQRDVATVAGGVVSVVASAAMGADPMAISTWYWGVVDGLTTRIQAGYAQTRNSSMGYLQRHAALSGHAGSVVAQAGSIDRAALRKRLEIVGPIGFKTAIENGATTDEALRAMATNMGGVADEFVRNGDRDVIVQTARHGSGVVGWRRRLSGRGCGFCAMLTSRGAVYVNRKRALVSTKGEPYHPHCRCWAEPLYQHEDEPADVRLLQRQWKRVTAGESGRDAMNAWRRHWERRATSAARQRAGILPRPAPAPLIGARTEVRPVLSGASSPEAVSRVLSNEIERITGRHTTVRLSGSVETAREHAEGVLRGVERFPDVELREVRTGALPNGQYATSEGGIITFSDDWSSLPSRRRYLEQLQADAKSGWHPPGGPGQVALHEVAHVLDLDVDTAGLALREVSGYAEKGAHEAVAEAIADVLSNGPSSRRVSREVFARADLAYAQQRRLGMAQALASQPGDVTTRMAGIAERLRFTTTREETQRLLANVRTVGDLREVARLSGVHLPARATRKQVEDEIVTWTIGRELTSSGITGLPLRVPRPEWTPLPVRAPRAAKATPAKATKPETASAATARSGRDALTAGQLDLSARAHLLQPDPLTRPERSALDEYLNDAQRLNDQIRRGTMSQRTESIVRRIDRILERSQTTSDAVLWRGLRSIDEIAGDAAGRSLVGFEWIEKGFSSTSASRRVSEQFAGTFRDPRPVLLRVNTPAGTHAATISEWGENALAGEQAEVLLARGTRFRIVADEGVQAHPGIPQGIRVLDVEIVQAAPARAVKTAPRKATAPFAEAQSIAAQLRSATSREQARALLEPLTVPKMRQVADAAGVALPSRATRSKVLDEITQWTVGRRLTSEAVSGFGTHALAIDTTLWRNLTGEARARARQAVIDVARPRQELLSEALELVGNQADPALLRRRIEASARRLNVQPEVRDRLLRAIDGDLTAEVERIAAESGITLLGRGTQAFDRSTMKVISGTIEPGTPVVVVRPGARFDPGDGEVVLAKAVVEPASASEAAAFRAGKLAPRSAPEADVSTIAGRANPKPGIVQGRDVTGDDALLRRAYEAGKRDGEWQASGAGMGSQHGGRFDPTEGGYVAHMTIARELGYDGLPRVATQDSQFFDLEGKGYGILHRGWGWGLDESVTGQELAQQYLYGRLHAGGGFGIGTNMSNDFETALSYASEDRFTRIPNSAVVTFALHPTARIAEYSAIKAERDAFVRGLASGREGDAARALFEDVGTFAMARGYDAMVARQGEHILLRQAGIEEWVIFNRTKVVAFDENGVLRRATSSQQAAKREAARTRQAAIDAVQPKAEALADLGEVLATNPRDLAVHLDVIAQRGTLPKVDVTALKRAIASGDPVKVQRAIDRISTKLGVRGVTQAGDITTMRAGFDVVGGRTVPEGAQVRVVRRGTETTVNGEVVVLSRPLVREVTPGEVRPVARTVTTVKIPAPKLKASVEAEIRRQVDLVPGLSIRQVRVATKDQWASSATVSRHPRARAYYDATSHEIVLHPDYATAAGRKHMDQIIQNDVDSHYRLWSGPEFDATPEELLANVIRHETGHSVAAILPLHLTDWATPQRRAIIDPLAEELGIDPPGPNQDLAAWWKSAQVAIRRKQLGGYAETSLTEALAEIWAVYSGRGDKAPRLIRRVGAAMRNLWISAPSRLFL